MLLGVVLYSASSVIAIFPIQTCSTAPPHPAAVAVPVVPKDYPLAHRRALRSQVTDLKCFGAPWTANEIKAHLENHNLYNPWIFLAVEVLVRIPHAIEFRNDKMNRREKLKSSLLTVMQDDGMKILLYRVVNDRGVVSILNTLWKSMVLPTYQQGRNEQVPFTNTAYYCMQLCLKTPDAVKKIFEGQVMRIVKDPLMGTSADAYYLDMDKDERKYWQNRLMDLLMDPILKKIGLLGGFARSYAMETVYLRAVVGPVESIVERYANVRNGQVASAIKEGLANEERE